MAKSKFEDHKKSNSGIVQALHYLAQEMGSDEPMRLILYFVAETLEQRYR